MQLTIHRGTHEIGGSCVELESDGKRIILDMGLPLDAETNEASLLPNIPGLDGSDPNLLAILLSHYHQDHYGLLKHVSDKIPVGIGADARNIIRNAAKWMPDKWYIAEKGIDFVSEKHFTLGPFTITPYKTDHASYDSYSLLVEANGKRLFYSGDFRIHGRCKELVEKFLANPSKNIDFLLLEGSSLGRLGSNDKFPSEVDIENELLNIFKATKGIALVQSSAQNIDRIVSIFKACKRSGRKLIIDLYTAIVLKSTGNLRIPQSNWPQIHLYIPKRQNDKIRRNKWIEDLKEHSKNRIYPEDLNSVAPGAVLLFGSNHLSDDTLSKCLDGATYIYSMWDGYWKKESFKDVREYMEEHKIPIHFIHTSGHASPSDLKIFVTKLKPKKIIPIHTFYPDKYKELFSSEILLLEDGQKINLSSLY